MNKTIAITIAAMLPIVLPACSGQTRYSVSGTSHSNEKTIYLYDQLSEEAIDSTVVKDGCFKMSGSTAKNALLSIRGEGDERITVFFNDGKPIGICTEDSLIIDGSPVNVRLSRYELESTRKLQSMEEKAKLFVQAGMPELEESLEQEYQEAERFYRNLLNDNRDNLIPAAFMGELVALLEPKELHEAFDPKYPYASHPATTRWKQIFEQYEQEMAAADKSVGKLFTDLEAPGTDGKIHKLSEFVGNGTWVLVDFWASWCGPCRSEMPNVAAAYEKYHPKGFDIVGLSFDNDKEAWLKAIKDLKMPWTHLSDLKGWESVAASTYDIRSIPASLLVDPQGHIVASNLRGKALGEKLAEIFGE